MGLQTLKRMVAFCTDVSYNVHVLIFKEIILTKDTGINSDNEKSYADTL